MKKRLLCALGAAAIMVTAVPTAFAADIPQAPTPQNSSECTIMPCADVIVYKYRFESGKYKILCKGWRFRWFIKKST